jgi:Transposase DDE domain
MPVRDAKRRGEGWLAGCADIGWSNSLGWYEGFRLLVATDPTGIITGFGFCAASAADQEVAETFFATRHRPNPRLQSVGAAFPSGAYVADKGFEGEENHRRWRECYGVRIIHPPKRNSAKRRWPKRLRRWVAGIRQIVETVYDKLFNTFGLWRERPHELSGLRARLAARVALHNFCIWLNDQLGRPRLAFAELLGW